METHDQTQTETFLTLLDEADDRFLFASIYPVTEESPAKCIHEWGTVDELFRKLVTRNEDGAGIYVVANKSTGAKDSDVTSVRAVFADQDVKTITVLTHLSRARDLSELFSRTPKCAT